MFIISLIFTQIIYSVAEVYNESIFQQSEPNNFQDLWHSYTFDTGAGNREELYFSNVGLDNEFESVNGVFAWKSLQDEEGVVIVGLGDDFLMVTSLNKGNNSFAYKEDVPAYAKALAMFQKWNAKAQRTESYLIVAIHASEHSSILKWYQKFNGRLKFIFSWPFHGNITHLDVIKINYVPKLLIINNKGNMYSAEIYSFNINDDLDIWLFEKINLDSNPTSVEVFDNNDNIFFCASFPLLQSVHIFKYSKTLCLDTFEKKQFVFHQKIFNIGLKSLTSFRVGFRGYLGVASKTSHIYYIGENLLFQPVSSLKLGSLNNWLAVPLRTYREDTLLLAHSDSDVSVITWTGDDRLEVLGSFSKMACKDDVFCSERIKRAALNKSTTFEFNGHQNLIISTINGNPLFFRLLIKLKPLPDIVTFKLKNLLNRKNSLERIYADQKKQINGLSEKGGPARIESTTFSSGTFEPNQVPETVSQTKNSSQVLTDVNRLKSTIESLNSDVNKFLADLNLGISPQGDQDPNTVLTNKAIDRITFNGDVLINELNLSNMNGYDVNELLTSSFRKNTPRKIGGRKTLKNLKAENVMFKKIGDIPASDIIFSDGLWEEKNKNVINGDIVMENKLNVLNNVIILPPKRNSSLSKASRVIPKHVYDFLNLEELEVIEDTRVQKTINGQPFILPVHSGQLNVLDKVNQARIEVVNVNESLEIGFINGKNFSFVLEQLLFKPSTQRQFDVIKVDGLFSASDIQADHLYSIDLSKGGPEFSGDKISEKLMTKHPSVYVKNSNLKKSEDQNLKRVIHVFENLEVDGILFSNKINNKSWVLFNDAVKKNEEAVTFTSAKKFDMLLTAKKISLKGTINGRFADHVLNNFSDQTVSSPQEFDNVKFKNLSLKGLWNEVSVNQLNKSIVKLSANNGLGSDLIFKDECDINFLNITNFVNDFGLKNKNNKKFYSGKTEFKLIKADKILLHGSLLTNNKINNMNLSNFSQLRVSLKSPEVIEQDLIHHNVIVSGDLSLESLNLNDVTSIINSGGDTKLIEKFLKGEIHRIKKLLVKGNITTTHGVNGFNVTKILKKGFCITKPGLIKGNITFENIVYFDNINVTNSIDGFSLKKLEKDIAFKHSHVFLNGPKNFSNIKVTRTMKARTLNGHLVQEIASLKGDETMKGPIRINGNVIVKGNLTTYASINNIVVSSLLRTYSTKFNAFIYSGDLELLSDQITINTLTVGGNIQNVSLSALLDDAILKESSFNMSGPLHFKGEVKFKGSILAKGFIHGVNFSKFYPEVIFINKPTKLKGVTIIEELALKVLETKGYFNSTLINNINTNDWIDDSIPLNLYDVVDGRKVFEDVNVLQDISVDFINNHLPSAMISLKKKQHIPTLALFPRIHTTSDLEVSGSVNGKNLINEHQDTVLVYGDQSINGKTLFSNEFVVNGSLFVDTVKGKHISNLITLDTEQKIKTPLKFKGSVAAKKDIKSLKFINNINLSDWAQNSVSLNQKQVLKGAWTVKGKIKAKNINGEGFLHETSLLNVSKGFQEGRLLALEMKNATEMEYIDQCHTVKTLSKQFSNLPYLFYQFEVADEIETTFVIDSVITFKINDEDYLIITFANECVSAMYKWNKNHSSFEYLKQVNIGPVSKWSVIYRNKATYLITSSLRNSISCEDNLQHGNVWVFKDDSQKYVHLVTTSAFADIVHKNKTSAEYYTIDDNGIIQQWFLEENGNISSKFLLNVGPGHYRFIDFRILGGLAISNGREIKKITLSNEKVNENSIFLSNAHIVALPVEGKTLIAVVVRDKIVIYENIMEEIIFSVIQTYRAGSVLWLNFGSKKQAFLIVASHHRLIEVYEYKSVAGFVKKMSVQIFSSRLQSATLPAKEKYQSDKFVIVIQKKKLLFFRADMMGDFSKNDSFC